MGVIDGSALRGGCHGQKSSDGWVSWMEKLLCVVGVLDGRALMAGCHGWKSSNDWVSWMEELGVWASAMEELDVWVSTMEESLGRVPWMHGKVQWIVVFFYIFFNFVINIYSIGQSHSYIKGLLRL